MGMETSFGQPPKPTIGETIQNIPNVISGGINKGVENFRKFDAKLTAKVLIPDERGNTIIPGRDTVLKPGQLPGLDNEYTRRAGPVESAATMLAIIAAGAGVDEDARAMATNIENKIRTENPLHGIEQAAVNALSFTANAIERGSSQERQTALDNSLQGTKIDVRNTIGVLTGANQELAESEGPNTGALTRAESVENTPGIRDKRAVTLGAQARFVLGNIIFGKDGVTPTDKYTIDTNSGEILDGGNEPVGTYYELRTMEAKLSESTSPKDQAQARVYRMMLERMDGELNSQARSINEDIPTTPINVVRK